MARSLRVIPLGGLGEIGKNMMALECDGDIIVIDAGVLFPEEDMLGVDLVIPDIAYLMEHRDRVRGILITHGHEDHTGALPYVLRELKVPVYAPRLAKGLIEVKLREHHTLRGARLEEAEPGKPIKLGCFRVEFFRVCHSIPDAMGLAIRTPLGLVVHTGDFKIDHTPVDGKPTDFVHLAELVREGVFLLLSDSTYAELPGYTPSETVVGEALERVIAAAPGRVMVATFASLISRVQQVLDAAQRHGRRVAFVGRSMVNNVDMALKMGYLSAAPDLITTLKEIKRLPPERVVIVTTGSQGEPTSALVRISSGDHRDVQIMPGDTVVISATPIPGNERVVSKTIDNLFRQGARVLYDKVALVHVHGHASQEELKLMISLTKPKYFVPVHGQHRHLKAHAELAQALGVPPSNTFVLEDGDVLELVPQGGKVVDRVQAGPVYVDGLRVWDMKNEVLRDRRLLARDGFVVVIITQDKRTGRVIKPPEVVSSGFVSTQEQSEIMNEAVQAVMEALNHGSEQLLERGFLTNKVKDAVEKSLYQRTGRRPMVIPEVLEV
ncbi:MAG: metallo-beta-lactamase [Dehalococcoidia bacterium]|nr:metallo-beta-lactamase [Dehalococcoidia bacterium]